jgi:hypothetical protein
MYYFRTGILGSISSVVGGSVVEGSVVRQYMLSAGPIIKRKLDINLILIMRDIMKVSQIQRKICEFVDRKTPRNNRKYE